MAMSILAVSADRSFAPHSLNWSLETSLEDQWSQVKRLDQIQGGQSANAPLVLRNHVFDLGCRCRKNQILMFRNGIPAADALKFATINGAKALKIDKDHGSIEVGKVGDLVIINGNPIENIRNTRNVQQVVRAGEIFEATELLEKVKGKLGPSSKDDEKDW